MTAHPNRSKTNRNVKGNPTGGEIRAARERAQLTQTQAGELIHGTLRGWQDYESEARRMHPGLFELFLIKTGQMNLIVQHSWK